MTRLSDQEKQALRDAGMPQLQANNTASPSWMVTPTPANIERYLRALSQFPPIEQAPKPVNFSGTQWKL